MRRISPSLFIGTIRQQKMAMTLPNIILPPVNFTPKVIDNFKDFFINFIIWPYECRGLSSLFSSSPICLWFYLWKITLSLLFHEVQVKKSSPPVNYTAPTSWPQCFEPALISRLDGNWRIENRGIGAFCTWSAAKAYIYHIDFNGTKSKGHFLINLAIYNPFLWKTTLYFVIENSEKARRSHLYVICCFKKITFGI